MKKIIKAATNNDELREALENLIDEGLEDDEFIELWNNYADGTETGKIYPMSEIEDILMRQMGMSLLDIISNVKEFYTDDEFFTIDNMDFIVSFSDIYETMSPFDRDELIDSIVNSRDSFGNEKIRDLLDEFQEVTST